jgi:type I restriction enzyme S subunit
MASEWPISELGHLLEPGRTISYGIVQPGPAVPNGVPIVRVTDIRDGRIATDSPLTVSPEIEANYKRTRLRGGELLLTLVGTVGESAVVPAALARWNTARAVGVIPVHPDIGSHWVGLAIRAPAVRHLIASRLNTTVQATLNLGDVNKLPIVLPSKPERDAISAVISALDDKIDLNGRMRETLETMARLLFKSWFVDFDPVHARVEGLDTGLPAPVANLFPAALVEADGREMPEGWTMVPLDTTAQFLNGLALQKYPPTGDGDLPVVKIVQLRSGSTKGADAANATIPADYVIEDGDVLFSWSGSLECIIWTGGRGALNQHLFKVTSREFPRWFYYLAIHQHLDEFRRIAAAKATTMGHIQRHHLSEAIVAKPPSAVLKAADAVIAPIVERMIACQVESRQLARIRDELLPKLISGEVRVPIPNDQGV